MPEELAFKQRLGNRGTIDCDKRFVFALAGEMDRLGDQFLASAAFTVNLNGRIGLGDPRYGLEHFLHLLALGAYRLYCQSRSSGCAQAGDNRIEIWFNLRLAGYFAITLPELYVSMCSNR